MATTAVSDWQYNGDMKSNKERKAPVPTTWEYDEANKALIMKDAKGKLVIDMSITNFPHNVLKLLNPAIIPAPTAEPCSIVDAWFEDETPQAAVAPIQPIIDVTTQTVLVREHQRFRKGRVETVKAHTKTTTKKVAINVEKLQLAVAKAQIAFAKAENRLEKAQRRDERHKCYDAWLGAAQRDFDKVEARLAAAKAALALWV